MSEREVLWEGDLPVGTRDRLVSHHDDDSDLEGCYVQEFKWPGDVEWKRLSGLECENTSMVVRIAHELADTKARLERAIEATRMLPDCSCSPLHTCGPCLIRFVLRAEEVGDE